MNNINSSEQKRVFEKHEMEPIVKEALYNFIDMHEKKEINDEEYYVKIKEIYDLSVYISKEYDLKGVFLDVLNEVCFEKDKMKILLKEKREEAEKQNNIREEYTLESNSDEIFKVLSNPENYPEKETNFITQLLERPECQDRIKKSFSFREKVLEAKGIRLETFDGNRSTKVGENRERSKSSPVLFRSPVVKPLNN